VRFLPQHPLPFRSLLQELMPGNRVVVRRIETAVIDREAYLLVGILDEITVPGETGEDREVALGDAERHVRAGRVAPLGDKQPVSQQETVRAAAGTHRSEGLVPWRPLFKVVRDHLA